jgi:Ca-activated chloride channel family protein
VLLFSGSNKMLSPKSVPATRANIEQALRHHQELQRQRQHRADSRAQARLRRAEGRERVAHRGGGDRRLRDGRARSLRAGARNLSKANVFAFGIGSSVNRSLMEGIARAGMGEPFIITDPVQAPEQAARFRRMVESPVLTSVKATFGGLDVYDVEPQALPDVLGERPVIVFGKWRGEPAAA